MTICKECKYYAIGIRDPNMNYLSKSVDHECWAPDLVRMDYVTGIKLPGKPYEINIGNCTYFEAKEPKKVDI